MPAPSPAVKADGETDGGQQGVKRAREESDDDDEGQPMEEESDVEMEASSEESE